MSKIKIVGFQTHFKLRKDADGNEVSLVGGVDYARTVQPLSYLPKDEFEVLVDYEPIKKGGDFETPEDLTKHFDICYFSYIDAVPFYIQLRVLGIRHGMQMIMDLDDNIWEVHPTHPSYKGDFEPTSEANFKRSAIVLDVDKLSTTNSYLKYRINKFTKRSLDDIEILPNFIDLTNYDYKKIPKRENKRLTIGYMGGSSHFPDVNKPEFTKAMTEIMNKYDHVDFKTTFYMPTLKALWGNRYKYTLGRKNVYRFIDEVWPEMMSECEIFVAPLHYSPYSRSKSYIKYLEYSAGKRPSVMEKITPYENVLNYAPKRGLLARSTNDWVKHLSLLIENEDKRKDMGEEAYKYVKKERTIQGNIDLYADFFREALDKKKKKS